MLTVNKLFHLIRVTEYLEKLDTGIKNNRYKQKNIVNLLKSDTVMTPDEMLQHYVTLLENKNDGIQQKNYAKILSKLRENVETGIARNANSKNCMVYGLTATNSLGNNSVVATFLGHFVTDELTVNDLIDILQKIELESH